MPRPNRVDPRDPRYKPNPRWDKVDNAFFGNTMLGNFMKAIGSEIPGFVGAFSWGQMYWNLKNGKASVIDMNRKRSSLLNSEVFLDTESVNEVIDASETHTIFSLSDLKTKAVAAETSQDNTTKQFSMYNDKFHIYGGKPFIAVPALITGESGMTFTTSDGTFTDPKAAIEACISDVEYAVRLEPEIISRPFWTDSTVKYSANFEIDLKDIVNNLIALVSKGEWGGADLIPECRLALYITSDPGTLYIDQWSARQSYDRINQF